MSIKIPTIKPLKHTIKLNDTISNKNTITDFSRIESDKNDVIFFEDYLNNTNVQKNLLDDNIKNQDMKENVSNNNTFEDFLTAIGKYNERFTATKVVIGSKVVSGVLDVIEHILDGLIWVGGKIVDNSAVYSNTKNVMESFYDKNIIDTADEFMHNMQKDVIAYNAVDNIEDKFHNTQMGSSINDASYIKYDSEIANKVENITKVGAELVGATAATIATGGAASPTMVAVVGGLGFAEGAGKKAQETYQGNIEVTGAKEVSIAFSGIANGASWIAKGLFGTATIKQIGNIGNIVSQSESIGNFAHAVRETLTTHKHRSFIAYILRTRNEARSMQNVVDTVGSIFDTLSESIDNNDSISRTATKVGTGLVTNIAINRVMDIGTLWARDRRVFANIAEITGAKDVGLKKSIRSSVMQLIEQIDTLIDSDFYETNLENQAIDSVFDGIERSN